MERRKYLLAITIKFENYIPPTLEFINSDNRILTHKTQYYLKSGETGYPRVPAPDKSGTRTRLQPYWLSQYPPPDIPGLPNTRVGYPVSDIAGTRTRPEILKNLKIIITVNVSYFTLLISMVNVKQIEKFNKSEGILYNQFR